MPATAIKTNHRVAILDIETNAIDNPDKLWCVVVKDTETGHVERFTYPNGSAGVTQTLIEYLRNYARVVGHNILGYDHPVLRTLVDWYDYPVDQIVDTLILSRMMHYKIEGGHSLASWGARLGFPKQDFDQFDKYSDEMVEYCVNDVELTHQVYDFLMKKMGKFWDAVKVEHQMVGICQDIQDHGFYFNKEKAEELHDEISARIQTLDEALQIEFPPKAKLIRSGVVKATKHGTISKVGLAWYHSSDYTCFTEGSEYSLFKYESFNPASTTQVVARFNELGWKPTERTNGYVQARRERDFKKLKKYKDNNTGWKVSERNLETLPDDAPEAAHSLVEYILLRSRLSTLDEWDRAYHQSTHAIHGTIMPIGTWPHRVAHRAPNMGNIPTEKSIKYNENKHRELALKYGREMRSCWGPRPGYKQVGCDISSAHLRILAHFCNDPVMIEAVTKGSSKDGTDIHTRNKEALGEACRDRDQSKTFIYSFINGAGVGKVAEILNCTHKEAERALMSFEEYYPGFREFKNGQIKEDLKRGFIYGLDGRPIIFPRPNTIIAAYLLSGEAAIAKHANVRWQRQLRDAGIPFWQLNFIHDEWQTEVSAAHCDLVGQTQVASIEWAGEKFKMRLPMTGEYKIGDHWYDTH